MATFYGKNFAAVNACGVGICGISIDLVNRNAIEVYFCHVKRYIMDFLAYAPHLAIVARAVVRP